MYILYGVTFGFHIINQSCSTTYHSGPKKIKSNDFRDRIEKKLVNELLEERISIINEILLCTHGIFWIPKEWGGGRAIVDYSRPDKLSLNNFTTDIAMKFTYNSCDNMVSLMEKDDFMSIMDISNA